ncbi:hypothetical protein AGOR_G00177420 [Albula goreensis]|uniref:Essential protein Yae1 N-terminal domain-containing protein n=1 Tax=Albula goreensis TaxID=1534307 RepID=A0A8T3CYQ0_9TELE|nr:hypothetical protein AGOR_G00177420 [Albula goreensis]
MSWVKAVSVDGDVFDEDGDDITLQNKEWKKNMEKRVKDGYRDGMDAGKEASLQVGFNLGYKEGAEKMGAVGQLKGILSALQTWYSLQQPESPVPPSVSQLLRAVVRHEEVMVEKMSMAQLQASASVGGITESMEDMEVEHTNTDTDCRGDGCGNKDCCRKGAAQEADSTSPPTPCQTTTQSSFSPEESLDHLLRSCMDLVEELGLPEQLFHHVQQLRNP